MPDNEDVELNDKDQQGNNSEVSEDPPSSDVPTVAGVPVKKKGPKMAAPKKTTPKATPKMAKAPAPAKATKAAPKPAENDSQVDRTIARLLKLVADGTRVAVLRNLSEGELHVGALCDRLDSSQPAISHHLAILRHAGVVESRRDGKNNFYSLTDTGERLAEVVQTMAA